MGSNRRKRAHSTAFRVFRAAIVAALSLWSLYVVGINLFLSTSLFERVIDGDPQTIDIHFRRGWSVIPGHIHARELSIRGRDSNVEWILELERADFDMSFLPLTRARFDVSRVHGHGISFRLRSRLAAPPTTPLEIAQAADLPPIDGLPPWSVRPPKTDDAEVWSDDAYHLWTAHLENVVADDVREIWIDRGHFEGNARIDGRFYFKPLRKVDVGPAHVTIRSGRVHVGPFPIADDLAGSVDATVEPFDPRVASGAEILHAASLSTELRARCPDIGSVPYTLPNGTRITGPIELRSLSLRVKAGRLANGTRVDVALPTAAIEQGAHRFTGGFAATAAVLDDQLTSEVESTDLAVLHAGRALLDAPRAHVSADSRALDLREPFGDLHVVVDLPRTHLPDARTLDRYIPKGTPLSILEGSAYARTHIEAWLPEKRIAANFSLSADDLALRLAKLRVQGRTTAEGSFSSYRWDTGHVEDANLRIDVAKGALAYERDPRRPLVDVVGLRVDAHAADLAADDPLRTLEARVRIPEGSIVAPGLLAGYLPKGSEIRSLGGHGRFALAADLQIVDHVAKGTVDLHSKDLGFSLRDFRLTAALRAQAKVHDWRWEHGDLALDDARVDIRNIAFSKGGRRGVTIRRLLLTAKSSRFDLTDPLAAVAFTANVEAADVHDPSMLNAFLPEGTPLRLDADDGLFAVIATARVRRHVAHVEIAASAKDVGVTDGTARVVGDVALEAVVDDWDLAKSTLAVRGARVALTNVKGRLSPKNGTELSARRIDVLAATPLLSIAQPTTRDLDVHLVVDNAEIPDARALGALLAKGSLFQIEGGRARLSADLSLSSTTKRATGSLDVVLDDAAVALDQTRFSGDFRVTAKLSRFDPDAATLDLGGSSVTMRNVAVSGVSTPTTGWSGDLVFDQASLRFLPDAVVDGGFSLEARDANPLFALIFRKDMPGVLVGLSSMDHLSASGRVTADAHGLFLHELDARGGGLRAHGSYASDHDTRRGAFVVEKGPFAIGVRLDPAVVIRFGGLRGWLEGERRIVEKVRLEPFENMKGKVVR